MKLASICSLLYLIRLWEWNNIGLIFSLSGETDILGECHFYKFTFSFSRLLHSFIKGGGHIIFINEYNTEHTGISEVQIIIVQDCRV